MLVAIGGLPGVGKTTVARAVAGALPAAHVRIDALEVALVRQGLVADQSTVGPHGYDLALAVADSCLAAGGHVVVDAVFDVEAARRPWDELAARHGTHLHWVRLVCSDGAEHRRRVLQREADLEGHRVPAWDDVTARVVDTWAQPHTVVDTVAADATATVLAAVRVAHDPGEGPYRPAMTSFWIVAGVLVVAALAAMLVHDRRAAARGLRFDSDGIGGGATASPDAYRSSPGSHPTGWGGGWGGGSGGGGSAG